MRTYVLVILCGRVAGWGPEALKERKSGPMSGFGFAGLERAGNLAP